MTRTSPMVRRRELGKQLRELRDQHNLTLEDVADELECSMTKISRLETGKGGRGPCQSGVRDSIRHYDVAMSIRAKLMALVREPKSRAGELSMRLVLDPFSGSGRVAVGVPDSRGASHQCFCRQRSTGGRLSTTPSPV
jgi:DNA-binding XRE family transcriptional regulator